jgi:cysteinyl-tRNA synthetase
MDTLGVAPALAPQLRLAGEPLPLLDRARIYVCGVTPYDVSHLGHAATFVWLDAAVRVLELAGVTAQVCRNVTDVDDVLTEAARRAGVRYDRFAAVQQYTFDRDMAALGVRRPDHEPRAHGYVGQVIALAAALLQGGHAYGSGGGVYLPGRPVAAAWNVAEGEARRLSAEFGGLPEDPRKRDQLDVTVWQPSAADEPAWDSPWGRGRPGWHAECAAMSLSVFGPAVDVHAGGGDLRYPHHAGQAALAEALTGVRPYARRWMHIGVVRIAGEKMAKSVGNLVLVNDLIASHPAAAIRLMLLDRQWSQPWDYEPGQLTVAEEKLERLYSAAGRPGAPEGPLQRVRAALLADLDVPTALAVATEEGGAAARLLVETLVLA